MGQIADIQCRKRPEKLCDSRAPDKGQIYSESGVIYVVGDFAAVDEYGIYRRCVVHIPDKVVGVFEVYADVPEKQQDNGDGKYRLKRDFFLLFAR